MKKNGMTLTELLVASALVGVVMIGVASFSLSISQLQGATSKTTVLSVRTTAVMASIAKHAAAATGDETNRGILGGGNGKKETLCFRQDINYRTNNPATLNYGDDVWQCYFITNKFIVFRCDPDLPNPVSNGSSCRDQELVTLQNNNWFTIVDELGVGPLEYIEINLEAIYDGSNQAPPAHPIDNPTYNLKSRFRPLGHSG